MQSVYGTILRLYPAEYQAVFAAEIKDTIEEAGSDCPKGAAASAGFFSHEVRGLLKGLVREWLSKWSRGRAYMSSFCLPGQESLSGANAVELESRIRELIACMEFAIANHDFPKARFYSDQERITRAHLARLTHADGLEPADAT